ncbi:DegT/DnrJ/EryC1/StrS family aminotransferase [Ramlibacter lithotrophicus]|uniref:DegT/DnrJ/EryC1/StrS family aminotransferase n=1 Tax=Ramlibacter lithotrophicus TaxID=2606681 RepID=UPI0015F2BFFC|nr:DegT/DnrJ/EryC1/StrS family aminotransferase [Ramlibacter lithotrophicus]
MENPIKVPFIDLKRYESGFLETLNATLAAMAANAQFIGGPEIPRLESRLSHFAGVSHAVTCANGTDALQLALRALDVGRGDTVLVPDVTFWATLEAVVNVGANPVTVDADIADGGVAFDALADGIVRFGPKAVIIAHLYGWGSSRLDDIRALCVEKKVALLEDGAQCFGAEYRGKPAYTGALISTTSFYPAKVLGGAGDGGAVFTDDAELAERVRRLGNHGRTAHYGYGDIGWNSRLDSLQAAFLNLSLDHIGTRIASRRASAALYRERLPSLGIEVMAPPADYTENGYCNVCLIRDPERKAALEAAFRAAGVGFGNIYPGVMSQQPGAQGVSKGHCGGNVGETLCASVLNLPLFSYMTTGEIQRVLDVAASALRK